MPEHWLRVNRPRIVDEYIDGEVIMIDMTTGTYYSLNPPGAAIWSRIQGPVTAQALVERSPEFFVDGQSSPNLIRDASRAFVAELLSSELVVEADEPDEMTSESEGTPVAFESPELLSFTEMQDLMLLDPVHEVAPAGWPFADPAAPSGDTAREPR